VPHALPLPGGDALAARPGALSPPPPMRR